MRIKWSHLICAMMLVLSAGAACSEPNDVASPNPNDGLRASIDAAISATVPGGYFILDQGVVLGPFGPDEGPRPPATEAVRDLFNGLLDRIGDGESSSPRVSRQQQEPECSLQIPFTDDEGEDFIECVMDMSSSCDMISIVWNVPSARLDAYCVE